MPKPNLIVLAHSQSWCSAISRSFPDTNQSWVLSNSAMAEESLKFDASAAIVELPTNDVGNFIVELSQLANNSAQLKLFVVGDHGLLHWRPVLRAAGVASWHSSLLQLPLLVQAVARHLGSVRQAKHSIESGVWRDLPWTGTASG